MMPTRDHWGGAGVCPRRTPRRARCAVVAAFALFCLPAQAAPFTPADDAVVLERLPDARDAAARDLRQLHARLVKDPRDAALAIEVASRELDRGRSLADPRYLGRAEAALLPWADDPAAPPRMLLLHAVLRQSTHDFPTARAELRRVLAREPRNAQARLTLATIAMVQADYAEAVAECGQLALLQDGLAPTVCTAAAMSLTGHARLALGALQLAWRDPETDIEPAPVRLWARTVAAETAARLGDVATAEALFREALALGPDDAYLLGAWADFLLDQSRPAGVVALLRDRTRVDPLLLRLALAEAALGQPDAAAHVADLKTRFATARLRNETIHQREEARFALHLLGQPAEALRLAQANWLVQREPADARVLVEAALAAGRPDAADPAAAWARDNGVEDVAMAALVHDAKGAAR